jgi:hypothetical protein
MKRLRLYSLLGLVALLLLAGLLAAAPIARAQSGGGYDLSWSTIDGGGGTSTGGAYALSGTIGQADAGAQAGGTYTAGGGFWASFTQALYRLYAPLITR